MRADRVNVILHEQQSQNSQILKSHSTLAHSLHDVHVARCVQNSSNSLGDGVVRGRGVCVLGETKSLSTSTRRGVRCSAVDESAHPQQKPLKLHGETWAGILRNQGPKIFGRWKSFFLEVWFWAGVLLCFVGFSLVVLGFAEPVPTLLMLLMLLMSFCFVTFLLLLCLT